MSIRYDGKTNINEKVNNLLREMINDEDLTYTIAIYEDRKNEKINKLYF